MFTQRIKYLAIPLWAFYALYLKIVLFDSTPAECLNGSSVCFYTLAVPCLITVWLVLYFFQWLGLMYRVVLHKFHDFENKNDQVLARAP